MNDMNFLSAITAATTYTLFATCTCGAQDWSGPYLGFDAGILWSSTDFLHHNRPAIAPRLEGNLVAGYLFQSRSLVWGLELKAGIEDRSIKGPIPDHVLAFHDTRLAASVSAKVGAPFGRLLPYVSAGIRATYAEWFGLTTSYTAWGDGFGITPQVAAGVEAKVTDNVSLKTELSLGAGDIFIHESHGATELYGKRSAFNIGLNFRF